MNTPRFLRWTACAALTCCAFSSPPSLTAQSPASRVITGRVNASDGARPLQGVTVLLRGSRFSTITAADGTYRL